MTYQEQLLTPEWRARRQQIIDRDWGYCTKCMSSKNLQVHHLFYIEGKMAWEYPGNALVTLCSDCHTLEHNKVPERGQTKRISQILYEMITTIQNG